jgi:hypothetical protein
LVVEEGFEFSVTLPFFGLNDQVVFESVSEPAVFKLLDFHQVGFILLCFRLALTILFFAGLFELLLIVFLHVLRREFG